MILSKEERLKLQKIIHSELQKVEKPSPANNLLFIMSALISDFEELESIHSETCRILMSGKDVTELLHSLTKVISSDVIAKLHIEGHMKLIQNLALLTDTVQNLQLLLGLLNDKRNHTLQ